MTELTPEQLLLLKEKIITKYLRGPKTFLPQLKVKPETISESGYLVLLVTKNGLKTILKLLLDQSRANEFEAELFVYQKLKELQPKIKNKIPQLYAFANKQTLKYIEIEYLEDYQPLGKIHEFSSSINNAQIKQIIKLLSLFHIKKKGEILRKQLNKIRPPLYYQAKINYLHKKNKILKIHQSSLFSRLRKILNSKKEIIQSTAQYLILGDRNPSHLLIQGRTLKTYDFNTVGIGNPAYDYTFIYLCLFVFNSQQAELLLKCLQKQYYQVNHFWNCFWFDMLIRSLGETYYYQEHKDHHRSKLCNRLFFDTLKKCS